MSAGVLVSLVMFLVLVCIVWSAIHTPDDPNDY